MKPNPDAYRGKPGCPTNPYEKPSSLRFGGYPGPDYCRSCGLTNMHGFGCPT